MSITLLGLGMGMGGVMLTFVLTCTLSAHYVDHVAWVGYGGWWGDVNVRINLYAFRTTASGMELQRDFEHCSHIIHTYLYIYIHILNTAHLYRCMFVYAYVLVFL